MTENQSEEANLHARLLLNTSLEGCKPTKKKKFFELPLIFPLLLLSRVLLWFRFFLLPALLQCFKHSSILVSFLVLSFSTCYASIFISASCQVWELNLMPSLLLYSFVRFLFWRYSLMLGMSCLSGFYSYSIVIQKIMSPEKIVVKTLLSISFVNKVLVLKLPSLYLVPPVISKMYRKMMMAWEDETLETLSDEEKCTEIE